MADSSSADSWRWVVVAGWGRQRLGVADVHQAGDQLQRVNEPCAGVASALDPEAEIPAARPPAYF